MTRYTVPGSGIDTYEAAARAARSAVLAREREREGAVDEALAESFPASDPPAWNPGMARPVPARSPRKTTGPPTADGSARTFVQMLTSLTGVAGIALLVPLAILLVGTPVVLVIRGALELAQWLSNAFR
jgi:hypothetical protein